MSRTSPSVQAVELGIAIRAGDQNAMAVGLRTLASQPGSRSANEIRRLAGLGERLLSFYQESEKELTAEGRDFLTLLVRKISGLLEAVDDERDDLDLAAWQERLAELCPVQSLEENPCPVDVRAADQSDQGADLLNRDLVEIFTEEFQSQLTALQEWMNLLQECPPGDPKVNRIRDQIDDCINTLSDNCRNLEFDELASCVEACQSRLHAAQTETERASAYTWFCNSWDWLRMALNEIIERGHYSAELARRMQAAGVANSLPGLPSGHSPKIKQVMARSGPYDECDAGIQQTFVAETEGILGRLGRTLAHWHEGGPEAEALASIRREMHSLKGAVTAAGLDPVAHLIHQVEALLAPARTEDGPERPELRGLLQEMHGELVHMLSAGNALRVPGLSILQQKVSRYLLLASWEKEYQSAFAEVADSWQGWLPDLDTGCTEGVPEERRLDPSHLSELIHASGELDLVWSELSHALDATRMNLELLRVSRQSLQAGVEEIESGRDITVEADRNRQEQPGRVLSTSPKSGVRLGGRLEQLRRVEQELKRHVSTIGTVLEQQRNLSDRLRTGLKSAGRVALGDYLPHLRYLVREIARKYDKEVDLECTGGDIQVDRSVMESLMSALGHLIRNAIVHGIESSATRQQAGKVPRGTISIEMSVQGDDLTIHFRDDGAGLPLDRIRSHAEELGLGDARELMGAAGWLPVITRAGFSTVETATLESGRGMGLNVVSHVIRDLGGTMRLEHTPGAGVAFHLRLPVSLAVTPALLIRVGPWKFALRSYGVDRLCSVRREEINLDGEEPVIQVGGEPVPVVWLPSATDHAVGMDGSTVPVVVVRLAHGRAAFGVDELVGSVDLLGRSPGTQLLSIPEISGVSVLPDSSIILILESEALLRRLRADGRFPEGRDPKPDLEGPGLVLVVDDSAVVRMVMQRDLELQGIAVDTAEDGLRALEMLERNVYDVILTDVDMPRMNGLELLEQVRAMQDIPQPVVVMVTSDSSEEVRHRALQLGADGSMTRPCPPDELDRMMRQCLKKKRRGT